MCRIATESFSSIPSPATARPTPCDSGSETPGRKTPSGPTSTASGLTRRRIISRSSQKHPCSSGGNIQGKIAFVDTYTLADFARSPSGFWYPTRVLRKTSNFEGEQVTRFALDFETAIPDSLFEHQK